MRHPNDSPVIAEKQCRVTKQQSQASPPAEGHLTNQAQEWPRAVGECVRCRRPLARRRPDEEPTAGAQGLDWSAPTVVDEPRVTVACKHRFIRKINSKRGRDVRLRSQLPRDDGEQRHGPVEQKLKVIVHHLPGRNRNPASSQMHATAATVEPNIKSGGRVRRRNLSRMDRIRVRSQSKFRGPLAQAIKQDFRAVTPST